MRPGVYGATLHGGRATLVRVEALLGRGLARVILVGMPDIVAKEARERLPAAVQRHGFSFPKGKVLFNLVPAQIPKGGLPLDLALACALLVAQGHLPAPRGVWLFLGELDLDGRLGAPARGTLLAALAAAAGAGTAAAALVITAREAAAEAALSRLPVYGPADLSELAAWWRNPQQLPPCSALDKDEVPRERLRLEDVRGQALARQAAILAAAGHHSLLLQGPPGTGKSLLARRIAGLLPPLSEHQAMELAQVEAIHGRLRSLPSRPPLRAPHTSISLQGLLGGGRPIFPGELSRAHGGVLFLDELPEFARATLESLRQPLEEKEVRIHRVGEWAVFPAEVLLIAARNPCPCGFDTHPTIPCKCTPLQKQRYQLRTSGPLLDRFDLFVEMGPVDGKALDGPPTPPTQEDASRQVATARAMQERRRRRGLAGLPSAATLDELIAAGVTSQARARLNGAAQLLQLSGRGYLRCLRVARTLADVEEREQVGEGHVLQALAFRSLSAEEEGATRPVRRRETTGSPPRSREPCAARPGNHEP